MPEDKIERAKQIIEEIAALQTELDTVEELLELNDKSTVTVEQKAAAFDKIFDVALEQIKYSIANGGNPKDHRYYLYEAAMYAVLGKNVFHVLNTYVT